MNKEKVFIYKGIASMRVYRTGHPCSPEKDKSTNNEVSPIKSLEEFDENFNVGIKISVGAVFMARFPNSIGSELKGDHLVVAVTNSNVDNPNVIVVPLTSLKDKHIKRTHCMLLGDIQGITNGKQSVAMLNQAKCIDKRRLLVNEDIERFLRYYNEHLKDFDDQEHKIYIRRYRLTLKQAERLSFTFINYIQRNGRIGLKNKLVDF